MCLVHSLHHHGGALEARFPVGEHFVRFVRVVVRIDHHATLNAAPAGREIEQDVGLRVPGARPHVKERPLPVYSVLALDVTEVVLLPSQLVSHFAGEAGDVPLVFPVYRIPQDRAPGICHRSAVPWILRRQQRIVLLVRHRWFHAPADVILLREIVAEENGGEGLWRCAHEGIQGVARFRILVRPVTACRFFMVSRIEHRRKHGKIDAVLMFVSLRGVAHGFRNDTGISVERGNQRACSFRKDGGRENIGQDQGASGSAEEHCRDTDTSFA